MKKILSLLVCLSALPAMAQTAPFQGVCENGGRNALTQGMNSTNTLLGVIPSCTMTVYLHGTLTKATIYADSIGTVLANPFTANALGSVAPGSWLFYAATGQIYDVTMSGGIPPNTFSAPVTVSMEAGGGGGGGGCNPAGAAGYFLLDAGSGGCENSLADYAVTEPYTFTFPDSFTIYTAVNGSDPGSVNIATATTSAQLALCGGGGPGSTSIDACTNNTTPVGVGMIAISNGNTSATINKAGAEVGAVVTVSNEEGDPSLSYVDFSNANVTLTADAEYYGLGAETNMGNVLISAWNCTGTGSEPNSCDGPTASENSGPDGNVEIEATSTASIDATGIGLESQANLTLDANSDQVNSGNVLISSQSTQSITHPFTQTGAVVIASSGPTTVDAENWGIDLHGNLSVTSCTGCGGGGMVWPTVAGIPYWTSGTAWGGAYNSSTPIPFSYLPTGTGSSNVVAGGVITAGGPTGGATAIPIITYNAAGQLTTVTTATPTVATVQGGAANEILYQTATNTTGFITAAASCIIGTNGSSVPSCLATILATNLPSALSSSSSMGTSCTVNASSTVTGVCGANTNTLNDGSGNGAIAGKWAVANFKNTNITAYALAMADSTSTQQPLIPSSWTSGHTFVPVWQPSGSALAPVTVDANTLAVSSASTATTAGSLSGTPTLCTTGQAPTGILSNGNATGCAALGGGTTTNALTAAATGGAAPGSTFNGSAAVTFDYHSFGAAALAAANSFTYGQTITSQAIGSVPLTLNGYSSGQTADLLDVYDYPGHTKQFYIQSNGTVQIPGNLNVSVEISGAYVEGGSFEGTGNSTTSTLFQTAGGLNYITGNSSAYAFNSASTQSAASNTPSAINIYGTVQYAGTVTGTWTGGIVETQVFGVGSADTYNGSAPIITSMSSKPTINVNTGSPVGYCEICSLPTETSVGAGVTNYFIKHAASGGALSSPNYSVTEGGFESNVGTQSVGTKFTTTGCSISSTTGGATAGKFTLGANSCSAVITMNGATGLTATNGWSCHANDETTAAGNTLLYFSANSATTATLSVPATAGTTDVIDFACTAF